MKELKYTYTATFLFPMLQVPKAFFDCDVKDMFGRLQFKTRFINAYLSDTCVTKYNNENYIFVLLRNYRDVNFDVFYSTLQAFPNYVDDYDNKECLIVVFRVPEETMEDYQLLLNGGYSMISKDAKALILKHSFFSGQPMTLPLILHKSDVLKESWETRLSTPGSPANLYDQEVWPIIDREKEELNQSIINSQCKKKHLSPTEEGF